MTAKTTTTTTLPLCELERIMEDGTRGVRQHHAEEEKEKNRKVVVSKTPGGGRGEGRWQQTARAATTPIAPMTSTCTCLQTAPAREYRRRKPAAELPAHPGRAGPGPRGAAIAVAHLHLCKDRARQGKSEQREDEARARGRDSSR